MDPVIRAGLDAHESSDSEFVERAFREVLRRPPDDEARERALAKLAEGTLSRASAWISRCSSVREKSTAPV